MGGRGVKFNKGRKRDKEEMDEKGERKGKGVKTENGRQKSEGRKRVKWDKQAGSHPESWKQTGTGGRVQ